MAASSDIKGWRRAIVLGAGRSGQAAARALVQRGMTVTLVDRSVLALRLRQQLLSEGIEIMQDVDPDVLPTVEADGVVVSPGIGCRAPWCLQAIERGLVLIGELELGAQLCGSKILAVTGTNGKSTLVKLCADHLNATGYSAMPAGNYGDPLTEVALRTPAPDWIVLEASTFQLETTTSLVPDVAVLLNIQPDHLDRHTPGDYRALKFSLFRRMQSGTGIVPYALLAEARARNPELSQWLTFGPESEADYRVDGAGRAVTSCDLPSEVDLSGSIFANPVLGGTAAAFVAAINACHTVSVAALRRSLQQMQGLEHRFEFVSEKAGVTFINDSKATNLAALVASLEMVKTPVRLIAGGILKEKELDWVKEVLASRTPSVYLIGEAAARLMDSWEGLVPCCRFDGLDEATRAAWRDADRGDTILLAPGCASFDQYSGYAERGCHFKELVDSIKEDSE